MVVPIYALGDDEPDIDDLAYVAPDAVVIGRVTRHHRDGLRRLR